MTNEEFAAVETGDVVFNEQTKEHFVVIADGPGNRRFLARLVPFSDPRNFSLPSGNAFAAVLSASDKRPFIAADDAPVADAPMGSGDLSKADELVPMNEPAFREEL